jgi:hypothetical protein
VKSTSSAATAQNATEAMRNEPRRASRGVALLQQCRELLSSNLTAEALEMARLAHLAAPDLQESTLNLAGMELLQGRPMEALGLALDVAGLAPCERTQPVSRAGRLTARPLFALSSQVVARDAAAAEPHLAQAHTSFRERRSLESAAPSTSGGVAPEAALIATTALIQLGREREARQLARAAVSSISGASAVGAWWAAAWAESPRVSPPSPRFAVHATFAELALRKRQMSAALVEVRSARDHVTPAESAALLRAEVFARAGQFEDLNGSIVAVMEFSKSAPEQCHALAASLERLGFVSEAARVWSSLVVHHPMHSEAQLSLARREMALGHRELGLAREQFARALMAAR